VKEVRKLAGQTLVYGMGTIVPRFLNYGILTFLYTRIFKEEEYGVITELYAWMVLMQVILTYGMETGFFRFSQKTDERDRVFSTSFISLVATSALFFIAVCIFIQPVAAAMNYRNNHDYIRMFAAILALDSVCAVPFAKLRRENKAFKFSMIKILNVIITFIVVIFLLVVAPGIYEHSNGWFKKVYDPEYGVGYVFIANLAGSGATLLMLVPTIIKVRYVFDRMMWQKMIGYSIPLMIAGLSGSINDAIDKILLRRMIGEDGGLETVGVYGAAYKVAVLMGLFIQMFRFAAEPFFFERAKHQDAKETYAYIMKYFVIIMLFIYLAINLYISGIQLLLGRNFREAIAIVPIVSMAYLFYGIYVNHSIWYKLSDLTRFGIYIAFIGAFITVILNVLLIPRYSYMASAWAHVASYGSMIILSFAFARKHYKVNYDMIRLVPYFLIAIAMVCFSMYFPYPNIIVELTVNTILFALFVMYAQFRDKVVTLFIKRSE
jgi:O-antigen/teichoic acid export membrane protein